MSKAVRSIRRGVLLVCAVIGTPSAVLSQSMTPMRGKIISYSDEFALKVYPRNIYSHSIDFEMKAYDQDFNPIDVFLMPEAFSLGAGATRTVTVIGRFGGAGERKIRVCAESVPYPKQQNSLRARICGRFLARQLH